MFQTQYAWQKICFVEDEEEWRLFQRDEYSGLLKKPLYKISILNDGCFRLRIENNFVLFGSYFDSFIVKAYEFAVNFMNAVQNDCLWIEEWVENSSSPPTKLRGKSLFYLGKKLGHVVGNNIYTHQGEIINDIEQPMIYLISQELSEELSRTKIR